MYTKTLITALAGIAAAAPASPAARDTVDTISLLSLRSTTAVHLQTVTENGLKFWIHKDTATYCPPEAEPCPTGNSTILLASPSSDSLSLYVNVPGGQQVYVASDGSLSATQAHSASTGDAGLRGPFAYTAAPSTTVGSLTFNGQAFTACPVAETPNVYQVFALGYPGFVPAAECIWFNLGPHVGTGISPVWQYI